MSVSYVSMKRKGEEGKGVMTDITINDYYYY